MVRAPFGLWDFASAPCLREVYILTELVTGGQLYQQGGVGYETQTILVHKPGQGLTTVHRGAEVIEYSPERDKLRSCI
eukprot:6345583-Amphidinium_carterae.1